MEFGNLFGAFFALFGLFVGVALLYSVIWSYFDAEERGKPGCLVALLVLFFSWPVGLLLWLIFRPEKSSAS